MVLNKKDREMLCFNLPNLSVSVSYFYNTHNVEEGEDVVLMLTRSGATTRETVITLAPTPRSAAGTHLLCMCYC